MSIKPYLLSTTNYKMLKDESIDIAVLPWGATEAHNYHLPYGTDTLEADHIAAESASRAWDQHVKVLVLPTVPFGVNTGQQEIPGTINIYPSTQTLLLNDILESVSSFGIKRLLILNSHGGNDFKQMLREAGRSYPEMLLVTANWYQALDKSDYFDADGDHADEMETSLLLHLVPELVLPLDEAGSGYAKKFKSKLLEEKWNWSERVWPRVTKDTGIGNPKAATAEKGKRYFSDITEKVAKLIIELAALDPENPYK